MRGRYQLNTNLTDSGLPWLGLMPAHWKVQRAQFLFKEETREVREDDGIVTVFRDGQVCLRSRRRMAGYTMADLEHGYQGIRKGDLVIHAMDAFAGAIGVSEDDGKATPEYVVVTPIDPTLEVEYFAKVLRLMATREYILVLCASVRERAPRFRFVRFKDAVLPVPPQEEQNQIARFLEYETARIDALIEKQQQLIALLKEKRQAVISHAVTKGLNPNAPLRDSGVEWLGMVPAHWTVCRVKQAVSFITSGPRGWSDLIADDGADIFLQSGDLDDAMGLVFRTAKRIAPPSSAEGVRTRMQAGDVVVCITGANTGRVAVADALPADVYVNQHLSLVRPRSSVVAPRFLATVLSSAALKSYFAVAQYGLKGGLSLTNVAEAPIVLPPLDEQRVIVDTLRKRERLMDALEIAGAAQIELLKERRTALISAAVTGKIDVRNWTRPDSAQEQDVA